MGNSNQGPSKLLHVWDLDDFACDAVYTETRGARGTCNTKLTYKTGYMHPKKGDHVGVVSIMPMLHIVAVGKLIESKGKERTIRIQAINHLALNPLTGDDKQPLKIGRAHV